MHMLARFTSLVSGSALVSTLGGGYFLCKNIAQARKMAERQIRIARDLGDEGMALRCSVHLVYNDIQQGHFEAAVARIIELCKAASVSEVRAHETSKLPLALLLQCCDAHVCSLSFPSLPFCCCWDVVVGMRPPTGSPTVEDAARCTHVRSECCDVVPCQNNTPCGTSGTCACQP